MASRIRHHVNPLSQNMLTFTPERFERLLLPLHVELGCAEGEFLFRFARIHEDMQILGIEIRRELVLDIQNHSREMDLYPRVNAVFANIPIHLGELFEPESVTRFYLNFPDPWFKKDQQKRRVLVPEVVRAVHDALVPGGEFFFQSDIFDTALDALDVTERSAPEGFVNSCGFFSFMQENPFADTPTRRERFVQEKGLRIWRFLFRKSV